MCSIRDREIGATYAVFEDDEILDVVSASPLEDAPDRLIALANERGGDDNITVIVVHAR